MGRKRKNIKLSYSQFEMLLSQVRAYSKSLGAYDALKKLESSKDDSINEYLKSEIVFQASMSDLKKKDLEKLLAEINLKNKDDTNGNI